MNTVHPTAVIEDGAELGEGNEIGPFCYITKHAKIGNNNKLVSHVCIGTPAQHRGDVEQGGVEVGNGNTFHEFSQVQASTNPSLPTRVSNNCYLMKGAHVAHDCMVEDDVTLCNDATLGGHTYVMRNTTLGFLTVVHQKQVIGSFVQTGMGAIFPKGARVEPGHVWAGNPAKAIKKNAIGIERAGITESELTEELNRYRVLLAGWISEGEKPTLPGIKVTAENLSEASILAILADYAKHRDGRYDHIKWDICDSAVATFGHVDWPIWQKIYDHTFSLLWQRMDDFKTTQQKIRQRLIEPARKLFKADPLPGGDRCAWLIRNGTVGMYAPYKHVRAFMEGQAKDGKPPLAYIYGPYDSAELRELSMLGIEFRIGSDPAEIRAWCEHDGVGTLIADSYSALVLTLFEMRSAPVQFYLSPGMQLFPADGVLVPPTQNHWGDNTIPVPSPMLWRHLYKDVPTKPKAAPIVFGALGRYEKITPEYLDTVIEILDQVPESVFCAYGRGALEHKDPRIMAMGYADPHEVLPNIDVYLDTFPTCGGVSVWEAMAHRVPVVTLTAPAWHSWNLFKPHVTQTKDDYIKTALRLLEQPETDVGYQTARRFADIHAAGKHLNGIIDSWQLRHTQNSKPLSQTG